MRRKKNAKSYGEKKILFHNSVIFEFREKYYTSQPPKTGKNSRGLLSTLFSKNDIWPFSDIVTFA